MVTIHHMHNGIEYTISRETRVVVTEEGEEALGIDSGMEGHVYSIKKRPRVRVNVIIPTPGETIKFSMSKEDLFQFFTVNNMGNKNEKFTVVKDCNFRGRNLKGMVCKVLGHIGSDVMVEMDENVDGTSCDGVGRRGHCVPLSPEALKGSDGSDTLDRKFKLSIPKLKRRPKQQKPKEYYGTKGYHEHKITVDDF